MQQHYENALRRLNEKFKEVNFYPQVKNECETFLQELHKLNLCNLTTFCTPTELFEGEEDISLDIYTKYDNNLIYLGFTNPNEETPCLLCVYFGDNNAYNYASDFKTALFHFKNILTKHNFTYVSRKEKI